MAWYISTDLWGNILSFVPSPKHKKKKKKQTKRKSKTKSKYKIPSAKKNAIYDNEVGAAFPRTERLT